MEAIFWLSLYTSRLIGSQLHFRGQGVLVNTLDTTNHFAGPKEYKTGAATSQQLEPIIKSRHLRFHVKGFKQASILAQSSLLKRLVLNMIRNCMAIVTDVPGAHLLLRCKSLNHQRTSRAAWRSRKIRTCHWRDALFERCPIILRGLPLRM